MIASLACASYSYSFFVPVRPRGCSIVLRAWKFSEPKFFSGVLWDFYGKHAGMGFWLMTATRPLQSTTDDGLA